MPLFDTQRRSPQGPGARLTGLTLATTTQVLVVVLFFCGLLGLFSAGFGVLIWWGLYVTTFLFGVGVLISGVALVLPRRHGKKKSTTIIIALILLGLIITAYGAVSFPGWVSVA